MASWGVKATHSGTCIVWPQDWQALDPETVAGLLTFENTPLIDSDQKKLCKYDDHMTTLARAVAWFANWPRTGIQLDNFLEHASLTMFEACAIQIFVFRDSSRLPQSLPNRPPWHRYPTFENQLPLKFTLHASVRLDPRDQVALPAGDGLPRRPALVCQLCTRIKSFNRVASLWSHVRKKHADRSIEHRLQEIRRSAALWGSYLSTMRTNPADPIMLRLTAIARDDFSWAVFEEWPM
ncbi:hypothetical protein F5Y08DRAFT_346332 [Xylaria arbuscula]|nr:hypothetical protein F5Y08DRAFT_346332 [Xylaria arbuscula]